VTQQASCVLSNVSRTFRSSRGTREALVDVSLSVEAGRTLPVIGESGAGKSTLARLICGLDRPTSGQVLIDGAPTLVRSGAPHRVQMVFQDPKDALNPKLTIAESVAEPLRRRPRAERERRVEEFLSRVGIDADRRHQRPLRFSGGQLQRVVLARALAADPRLLICDEPTSALDVSVQAQIINLLLDVQQQQRFACILVTHDLQVAKVLADDVLVLRRGRVEEMAPADAFFDGPATAYGRSLLEATAS